MQKLILTSLLVSFVVIASHSAHAAAPQVVMQTNFGNIVLELYPDKAPKTVENFLMYVDNRHYDGTVFHRVIKGFMIQGGGFNQMFHRKPTLPPINNEANSGLLNKTGTIAMARTSNPHSATAQFFINTVNNSSLDFKFAAGQGWGYTVFGRVVEGMETVYEIEAVATGQGPENSNLYQDVPVKPVVLIKAYQAKQEKPTNNTNHKEKHK